MNIKIVMLFIALIIVGFNQPITVQGGDGVKARLAVGQIWKFRARPSESTSMLTIVKIEEVAGLGKVVHVSLSGLHIKNPKAVTGFNDRLPHAPFSEQAIIDSVTELVGQTSQLPDFEQGYHQWQQNRGGVFTTSVADVIEFAEQSVNS